MRRHENEPWQPPPSAVRAVRGTVHVWRIGLILPQTGIEGLAATLTPDETARAARYRFAVDAQRFIVTRGALRAILGGYVDADPAAISFACAVHGKPLLAFPDCDVRFNVSHCDSVALAAVSAGQDVGVDVEAIRAEVDMEPIARRYFQQDEADRLMALPAAERPARFCEHWTTYEALVKADGCGVGGIEQFTPLGADQWQGPKGAVWEVRPIPVGEHHRAALATDCETGFVECFEWTPRSIVA